MEVEGVGGLAGRQKHNFIKLTVLQAPVCPSSAELPFAIQIEAGMLRLGVANC